MTKNQDNVKREESKDENDKEKAGLYEYYEATVTLIKAIIWPVIILYFFLTLRGPITATVEQLPNLFYKTTHITIAGVTLEIDQRLQAIAPPQLQEALSKLSANALKELVSIGEATHYTRSSYPDFAQLEPTLKELDQTGLITLETTGVADPKYPDDNIRYKATDIGRQAYAFVVQVMVDQLLRSVPADSK